MEYQLLTSIRYHGTRLRSLSLPSGTTSLTDGLAALQARVAQPPPFCESLHAVLRSPPTACFALMAHGMQVAGYCGSFFWAILTASLFETLGMGRRQTLVAISLVGFAPLLLWPLNVLVGDWATRKPASANPALPQKGGEHRGNPGGPGDPGKPTIA